MKLFAILFTVACILSIFAAGVSADPKKGKSSKQKKPTSLLGNIISKVAKAVGGGAKGVIRESAVDTLTNVATTQINKLIEKGK